MSQDCLRKFVSIQDLEAGLIHCLNMEKLQLSVLLKKLILPRLLHSAFLYFNTFIITSLRVGKQKEKRQYMVRSRVKMRVH